MSRGKLLKAPEGHIWGFGGEDDAHLLANGNLTSPACGAPRQYLGFPCYVRQIGLTGRPAVCPECLAVARGSKPLGRTSRLRRRSEKTARVYREVRVPLVKEILEAHPWCQRCNRERSTQVHEILTRARGGSITDRDNCRALCFDCHDWIHLHPKQATDDGWLRHAKEAAPERL